MVETIRLGIRILLFTGCMIIGGYFLLIFLTYFFRVVKAIGDFLDRKKE